MRVISLLMVVWAACGGPSEDEDGATRAALEARQGVAPPQPPQQEGARAPAQKGELPKEVQRCPVECGWTSSGYICIKLC